jgi:hypothetical protein
MYPSVAGFAKRRHGVPCSSAAATRPGTHARVEPVETFVYVRAGPSSILGEPYYRRRLEAETANGKRALDEALAVA